MAAPRLDLILDPERLQAVPVYKLLEAASAGYLGVDHRFLRAIIDRLPEAIPDLTRFASEDHTKDPIDPDELLVDIFCFLRTPEALSFLIPVLRRKPGDMEDDLAETLVQLGAPAVDPLLRLLDEFAEAHEEPGEILFYLALMRLRDPRIFDALLRHLEHDVGEGALFLDFYGDPAAIPALEKAAAQLPEDDIDRSRIKSFIESISTREQHPPEPIEPFDIWDVYPDKDSPPLELLNEADHAAMLDAGSSELKSDVASLYRRGFLPDAIKARILVLAKSDPDAHVRSECWETLEETADEPEVRKALLAVLGDENAPPEEKAGAVLGLARHIDNKLVVQTIEALYALPETRAKALKAMGRSFDRRFAAYPPQHLDDPDAEIRRQAIWAVGYLTLSAEAPRLEKFFDDDEFRSDALFAYALSMPGETSRGRARTLLRKVEQAAGGFQQDEEGLIEVAIDQRLMLRGLEPVFSGDEDETDEEEPVVETAPRAKVGRNDPCPCGSGKKYKKCCGAGA